MAAQYANGFSITVKENLSEIIIDFTQSLPVIGPKGKVIETKSESISTIIINQNTAVALQSNLKAALQSSDTQE